MTNYNYNKIRGKIIEEFGSNADFAKAMEISTTTLSNKLNNKVPWTQIDIEKAIKILGINSKEINQYFFTPKIQKTVYEH